VAELIRCEFMKSAAERLSDVSEPYAGRSRAATSPPTGWANAAAS